MIPVAKVGRIVPVIKPASGGLRVMLPGTKVVLPDSASETTTPVAYP